MLLPIYLRVAAALAGLFSAWQVVYLPFDIRPFFTLPGYEHFESCLNLVGLGPGTPPIDVNETEDANLDLYFLPENTVNNTEDNADLGSDDDFLVSVNDAASDGHSESWEDVGPKIDEEIASHGQAATTMLASFDNMLDYVFSFVEKYPTSALETSEFILATICIICIVFWAATISYWALPLLALRGQDVRTAPKFPDERREISLQIYESKNDDALSLISDIIPSTLEYLPSQKDNSHIFFSDPMEILAFATDIAKTHSSAVKEDLLMVKKDLDVHIKPLNENNKSESEAVKTARHQLQTAIEESRTLNTEALKSANDAVSAHASKLTTVLEELEVFKSNFRSVEKILSEQREANVRLLKDIEEKDKAHEIRLLRVTSEADDRVSMVMNKFEQIQDTLVKKADGSTCDHLTEKITNLENSVNSISSKLVEHQNDAETMHNNSKSEVPGLKKELTAISNKVQHLVTNRKLDTVKEDISKLTSLIGHDSGSHEKFRNETALKISAISKDVAEVRGTLKSNESEIAALTTQVSDTFQASEMNKEISILSEKVDAKADTTDLNAFKTQLSAETVLENLSNLKEVTIKIQSQIDTLYKDIAAHSANLKEVETEMGETIRAKSDKVEFGNVERKMRALMEDLTTTTKADLEADAPTELTPVQADMGTNTSQPTASTPQEATFTQSDHHIPVQTSDDVSEATQKAVDPIMNSESTTELGSKAVARPRNLGLSDSSWAPHEDCSLEQKMLREGLISPEERMVLTTSPNCAKSIELKDAYPARRAANSALPSSILSFGGDVPPEEFTFESPTKIVVSVPKTSARNNDSTTVPTLGNPNTSLPAVKAPAPGMVTGARQPTPNTNADNGAPSPYRPGQATPFVFNPPTAPSAFYTPTGPSALNTPTGPSAFNPPTSPSLYYTPTDRSAFHTPTGPRNPRANPAGQGPGPQGGQRTNSNSRMLHNQKNAARNTLRKILGAFTDAQRADAYSKQNQTTLLFARGSGWEWLNAVVNGREWVEAPRGWSPPQP